jgi:hypothetical protein
MGPPRSAVSLKRWWLRLLWSRRLRPRCFWRRGFRSRRSGFRRRRRWSSFRCGSRSRWWWWCCFWCRRRGRCGRWCGRWCRSGFRCGRRSRGLSLRRLGLGRLALVPVHEIGSNDESEHDATQDDSEKCPTAGLVIVCHDVFSLSRVVGSRTVQSLSSYAPWVEG